MRLRASGDNYYYFLKDGAKQWHNDFCLMAVQLPKLVHLPGNYLSLDLQKTKTEGFPVVHILLASGSIPILDASFCGPLFVLSPSFIYIFSVLYVVLESREFHWETWPHVSPHVFGHLGVHLERTTRVVTRRRSFEERMFAWSSRLKVDLCMDPGHSWNSLASALWGGQGSLVMALASEDTLPKAWYVPHLIELIDLIDLILLPQDLYTLGASCTYNVIALMVVLLFCLVCQEL